MPAHFLLGVFVPAASLVEPLQQLLVQQRFVVSWSQSPSEFEEWVVSNRHRIDCLIIQSAEESFQVLSHLQEKDILLPTLALYSSKAPLVPNSELLDSDTFSQGQQAYHQAVLAFDIRNISDIDDGIYQAVDSYLQLPTEASADSLGQLGLGLEAGRDGDKRLFLLSLQQQRLAEKLKERLGYIGVYYRRNQQNFLRYMSAQEREECLDKVRQDYRRIILNYFADDESINQKIDDFVNVAFFADMSVPKIVEIHMELIEDFSKQLKLEGRSDETLTDYRLTLIDVIAHLCEMYRRSIPRDR
ncbi:circadian clock protein KaiA [cf. Phormidesmis sp. LEGE 11477]|uniref:circadian clock protein KaiA n=1 Tax=cf. Phormidesmis sp. LEGE 11477 TaxID=1828680 RepID=UPI00187F3813|nr:circadian clock protein KaiA [cf. Phormidesmis sp. LEGE 11477]MBE9064545.1 circadian clock protein KaiA [cf. Phormidesmis sp. LEGE 11477]